MGIKANAAMDQMIANRNDISQWHEGHREYVYVVTDKGNRVHPKAVYYHAHHDAKDTMHPVWVVVTRGDKYWVLCTHNKVRPRKWIPLDVNSLDEAKAVALVMDRMG